MQETQYKLPKKTERKEQRFNHVKKPEWLRKKISFKAQKQMNQLLTGLGLHTICEEAKCPNISECFAKKQATFLILGDICTRRCTYCNVKTGRPEAVNQKEIQQVTEAILRLDLRHVVITSPARDDLTDGGSNHFYNVVRHIKAKSPKTALELLIPDFQANVNCIKKVVDSKAEIVSHNIETVAKFHRQVRKAGNYKRSLEVLKIIDSFNTKTKTGIMVGFGETEADMIATFKDLLSVNCRLLSIGQYLPPSFEYEKVIEYVKPVQFMRYKKIALDLGFKFVHSSPYTRSSFMAHEYLNVE